jgi:hypothetical protein
MISIISKATFKYVFNGVSYWVHSGEVINIDPRIPEKRELLKYFLSKDFESLRKFFYIDLNEAKKYLTQEEIEDFSKDKDSLYLEVPSSFYQPIQEALPNSFIKEVEEVKSEPKKEIKASSLDSIKLVEDKKEFVEIHSSIPELDSLHKEEKEKEDSRREELENSHWNKIKNIAEEMGLQYSNKPETIKKILEKEFNRTEDSLDFI